MDVDPLGRPPPAEGRCSLGSTESVVEEALHDGTSPLPPTAPSALAHSSHSSALPVRVFSSSPSLGAHPLTSEDGDGDGRLKTPPPEAGIPPCEGSFGLGARLRGSRLSSDGRRESLRDACSPRFRRAAARAFWESIAAAGRVGSQREVSAQTAELSSPVGRSQSPRPATPSAPSALGCESGESRASPPGSGEGHSRGAPLKEEGKTQDASSLRLTRESIFSPSAAYSLTPSEDDPASQKTLEETAPVAEPAAFPTFLASSASASPASSRASPLRSWDKTSPAKASSSAPRESLPTGEEESSPLLAVSSPPSPLSVAVPPAAPEQQKEEREDRAAAQAPFASSFALIDAAASSLLTSADLTTPQISRPSVAPTPAFGTGGGNSPSIENLAEEEGRLTQQLSSQLAASAGQSPLSFAASDATSANAQAENLSSPEAAAESPPPEQPPYFGTSAISGLPGEESFGGELRSAADTECATQSLSESGPPATALASKKTPRGSFSACSSAAPFSLRKGQGGPRASAAASEASSQQTTRIANSQASLPPPEETALARSPLSTPGVGASSSTLDKAAFLASRLSSPRSCGRFSAKARHEADCKSRFARSPLAGFSPQVQRRVKAAAEAAAAGRRAAAARREGRSLSLFRSAKESASSPLLLCVSSPSLPAVRPSEDAAVAQRIGRRWHSSSSLASPRSASVRRPLGTPPKLREVRGRVGDGASSELSLPSAAPLSAETEPERPLSAPVQKGEACVEHPGSSEEASADARGRVESAAGGERPLPLAEKASAVEQPERGAASARANSTENSCRSAPNSAEEEGELFCAEAEALPDRNSVQSPATPTASNAPSPSESLTACADSPSVKAPSPSSVSGAADLVEEEKSLSFESLRTESASFQVEEAEFASGAATEKDRREATPSVDDLRQQAVAPLEPPPSAEAPSRIDGLFSERKRFSRPPIDGGSHGSPCNSPLAPSASRQAQVGASCGSCMQTPSNSITLSAGPRQAAVNDEAEASAAKASPVSFAALPSPQLSLGKRRRVSAATPKTPHRENASEVGGSPFPSASPAVPTPVYEPRCIGASLRPQSWFPLPREDGPSCVEADQERAGDWGERVEEPSPSTAGEDCGSYVENHRAQHTALCTSACCCCAPVHLLPTDAPLAPLSGEARRQTLLRLQKNTDLSVAPLIGRNRGCVLARTPFGISPSLIQAAAAFGEVETLRRRGAHDKTRRKQKETVRRPFQQPFWNGSVLQELICSLPQSVVGVRLRATATLLQFALLPSPTSAPDPRKPMAPRDSATSADKTRTAAFRNFTSEQMQLLDSVDGAGLVHPYLTVALGCCKEGNFDSARELLRAICVLEYKAHHEKQRQVRQKPVCATSGRSKSSTNRVSTGSLVGAPSKSLASVFPVHSIGQFVNSSLLCLYMFSQSATVNDNRAGDRMNPASKAAVEIYEEFCLHPILLLLLREEWLQMLYSTFSKGRPPSDALSVLREALRSEPPTFGLSSRPFSSHLQTQRPAKSEENVQPLTYLMMRAAALYLAEVVIEQPDSQRLPMLQKRLVLQEVLLCSIVANTSISSSADRRNIDLREAADSAIRALLKKCKSNVPKNTMPEVLVPRVH